MRIGSTEKKNFNLYQFQIQSLPLLAVWSLGSMIIGALWMRNDSKWHSGLGSQFVGWGLIDGIIAAFGIKRALYNQERLVEGKIDQQDLQRQSINFERLLWVNAILDMGYILTGGLLIKRNKDNAYRRGIGWGITTQGAFLLVWDAIQAILVRERRDAA